MTAHPWGGREFEGAKEECWLFEGGGSIDKSKGWKEVWGEEEGLKEVRGGEEQLSGMEGEVGEEELNEERKGEPIGEEGGGEVLREGLFAGEEGEKRGEAMAERGRGDFLLRNLKGRA